MADPNAAPAIALRVERTFAHPREHVFDAWTDAATLTRWFAPNPQFRTVVTDLDVRPGGRYRIEMHAPDGNVHIAVGTYTAIERPSRLAFTWRWEQNATSTETLVTIEFSERDGRTTLTLTHERFPSTEERDHHEQGWQALTGRIESVLTPV